MVAESINGSCLRDTDFKITCLVDEENVLNVVFLDISKTDYTVLRGIFWDKFSSYEANKYAVHWVKNWLKGL